MENHNPADHGGRRAGVVCLRKVECHSNFHFFGKENRVQKEQFRCIDEETRTRGAEHADGIAAIHLLEKILLQILVGAIGITGIPAITNLEAIVCIYTMLKIIGQLLILNMGRQDTDPRFRLTSARITSVLGYVRCCLLMYISLHVMPWPIFVLRVLELMNP